MKPTLLIAILLLTLTLSAQAEELSLESCINIEDTSERLACYDRLAGRLPAAAVKANPAEPSTAAPAETRAETIAAPATVVTKTVPEVKSAPDGEAIFGFEHKPVAEEEWLDELQVKRTKLRKDGYGKWVIWLENGQVWRQTDSRSFNFVNSDQLVVITRSFLGSFFLGEPDRHGGIRIKRVK